MSERVKAILLRDLDQAERRASSAKDYLAAVSGEIPGGLPHPDGTRRIESASLELRAAQDEVMKAHNRSNEFQKTGVVPEDLKAERLKLKSSVGRRLARIFR
jgi:hypothetical protein